MNKAAAAFPPSSAASSILIMNQKNSAAPSTTTNITSLNGKASGPSIPASIKTVPRNGAPGVPPKPPMISYRGDQQQQQQQQTVVKSGTALKANKQSDKSLTDDSAGSPVPPDARAKQVLKEAVNAVVNSFAKHSQGGYGRGE